MGTGTFDVYIPYEELTLLTFPEPECILISFTKHRTIVKLYELSFFRNVVQSI